MARPELHVQPCSQRHGAGEWQPLQHQIVLDHSPRKRHLADKTTETKNRVSISTSTVRKLRLTKFHQPAPVARLVRERARFSQKCCSDMRWGAWETKPTSHLLGSADMASSAGHCCANLIPALLEECSSHQQSKRLTTVPHILLNKLILASCKWE